MHYPRIWPPQDSYYAPIWLNSSFSGSMCLFSGGFGALNPAGSFFFSLFPPSGVYSFLRQKHQAVWNQAGAAAQCQEEVFFPFSFFFWLWFLSALHQGSMVQSCNASGVSRAWGHEPPCVTLTPPPPPPLPEDSCRSSFHHADTNNRMTKTWL